MGKRILGRFSLVGLVMLLGFSLWLSGCGEPGYLDGLAGKRLGVYLETEAGSASDLNAALTDYISRRTKLEVVGTRLMGEVREDSATFTRLRSELGLDYLLLVQLTDISPVRHRNDFDIVPGKMKMSLEYQCRLNLTYKIIDLATETPALIGQKQGRAGETQSFHVDRSGVDFDFDPVDEDQLIEQAMFDAIRRSRLLQQKF